MSDGRRPPLRTRSVVVAEGMRQPATKVGLVGTRLGSAMARSPSAIAALNFLGIVRSCVTLGWASVMVALRHVV